MTISRDAKLRQILGDSNCGQYNLSGNEQFQVLMQIVKLISSQPKYEEYFDFYPNITTCLHAEKSEYYSQFVNADHINRFAIYNKIPLELAIEKISEIVEINKSDLFNPGFNIYATRSNQYNRIIKLYDFDDFPKKFLINGEQWFCIDTIRYDYTDKTFQAGEIVYMESKTHRYFILPYKSTLNHDGIGSGYKMYPGYYGGKFTLLNKNQILREQGKTIIIFHDKIIASRLLKKTEKLNFIPTAVNCNYGNFEHIDFSDIAYRDVIIAPLPSVECFRWTLDLCQYLNNKNVNSVKISISPVLPFVVNNKIEYFDIPDKFIHHIYYNHLIYDDDIDYNSLFENGNRVLDPVDYKSWLLDVGLLYNTPINKVKFRSSISEEKHDNIDRRIGIDIHNLFAPNTISFCAGDSGVGKSIFCLTLALSFSCGFDVFDISSKQCLPVLYLDYETKKYQFQSNLRRLFDEYNIDESILLNNFKYLLYSDNEYTLEKIFDDDKQSEFFSSIENHIKECKIKLIVIDTLDKAAPRIADYQHKVSIFIEWVNMICKKYDLSFLFLHYITNGRLEGAKKLTNSADNVIFLSKYLDESYKNGCAINILLDKSKQYPGADFSKSFYLNINSGKWENIKIKHDDTLRQLLLDLNSSNANLNKLVDIIFSNANISAKNIRKNFGNAVSSRTILNWIKEVNLRTHTFKIQRNGDGPKVNYSILLLAADQSRPPIHS